LSKVDQVFSLKAFHSPNTWEIWIVQNKVSLWTRLMIKTTICICNARRKLTSQTVLSKKLMRITMMNLRIIRILSYSQCMYNHLKIEIRSAERENYSSWRHQEQAEGSSVKIYGGSSFQTSVQKSIERKPITKKRHV